MRDSPVQCGSVGQSGSDLSWLINASYIVSSFLILLSLHYFLPLLTKTALFIPSEMQLLMVLSGCSQVTQHLRFLLSLPLMPMKSMSSLSSLSLEKYVKLVWSSFGLMSDEGFILVCGQRNKGWTYFY